MKRLKDNKLQTAIARGMHDAGLSNITTKMERTMHDDGSKFLGTGYHASGKRVRVSVELTDAERARDGEKVATHARQGAYKIAVDAIEQIRAASR